MRECKHCGVPYQPGSGAQKWCSPQCSKAAFHVRNPDAQGEYDAKRKKLKRQQQSRKSHLWTTYGMTMDEYNQMFAEQEGCCAICGEHQTELRSRLCVDHSHTTGKVRGLLCGECNKGLGHFKDNPEALANAISYLKE